MGRLLCRPKEGRNLPRRRRTKQALVGMMSYKEQVEMAVCICNVDFYVTVGNLAYALMYNAKEDS
jgi:hypothetical protein